ncbi:protein indeterminate-domain 11-like [Salvia hispanica]|uniref:protein indeterminate-domain 11-like n=1 Tax=Salvia hispanica TaxID=49212 RepID=UPI0020090893|nr:protein indeterminate-domain 11-like [Salvia hispanica]
MMKTSATQEENISNLTTASTDASASSTGGEMYPPPYFPAQTTPPPPPKKKRSQPGHPDPGSEVISLSPRTLMATNRFVCEICSKGFQRDQNLQLHRRGHNLPWKLKQRSSKDVMRKKVYVCPETSCVHHDPSRALGDLTGIKKHFCRKHGEKKWKCEKCSKKYAVQSDWKAHSKTCGTREYRCDCGTLFSRRDSFITHRAFCDALAEESAKSIPSNSLSHHINLQQIQSQLPFPIKKEHQTFTLRPPWLPPQNQPSLFQDFQENPQNHHNPNPNPNTPMGPTPFHHPAPHISATALLQKATEMGSKSSGPHHTAGETTPTTAGFGLKLASREHHHFINGLAPLANNKAAPFSSPPPPPNSHSMLHEMMMISASGFDHQDSAFGDEDLSFAGILNNNTSSSSSSKRVDESLDFDATLNRFGASSGGNHDDGMTRDFLGLRPLSQSDILSFAGLSNCITTTCGEHQSQAQRSWQG